MRDGSHQTDSDFGTPHPIAARAAFVGLLAVCCHVPPQALAADENLPDPDAEGLTVSQRFDALMTRAEKQQADLETLEASFRQRHQSEMLLEPQESRGTIFYRAPDCVRWDFETPTATTVIVCDGDMLTWYREQGLAERRDVGDSADTFMQLLGPGASIETLHGYFDITASFPEAKSDPYRLELEPRVRRIERRLRSLTLGLDRELFLPTYVRTEEANGDVTELHFEDLKLNEPIPAERFEPELPDDVEVRPVD